MRWVSWIALAAAGLLSISSHLGWVGEAHPPDLDQVPAKLGPFERKQDHDLVPEDLGELVPDRFRFSEYRGEDGNGGNLFIAYYARARSWSGRPHDVGQCYLAAGWQDKKERILTTPAGATLHEKHLTRQGRDVVVVYWWQRPGVLPAMAMTGSLKTRFRSLFSFRPDLVTVSWEFEANEVPTDQAILEASDDLITAIDRMLAE
ncbi:MAG: exosortase-associated EpsI family protein [Planctomycetota bacterium]